MRPPWLRRALALRRALGGGGRRRVSACCGLASAAALGSAGAASAAEQPPARDGGAPPPPKPSVWVSGACPASGDILACVYDTYDGVIVDGGALPAAEADLRRCLTASIAEWRRMGKRGVWVKVPTELVRLLPVIVEEFGFSFHHAERAYVVLNKWLPERLPCSLPNNATHTVGVGAVVLNSRGEVLMVRERSGPAARLGIWKLPTGMVDAGEEMHHAVVREVKEETGLVVRFEGFAAFRSSHAGNLAHEGKTNLYFVARCTALTEEINLADGEIAEARWFSADEAEAQPFPAKGTVYDVLNHAAREGRCLLLPRELSVRPDRPGYDRKEWVYCAAASL
eukprot:TRINITY_DN47896_c0_g1_i1.p1 TRINITY_DN47896_c0_g1~~TRINITY_DN47896_c0_g1_i1.p1  ORF type:complete len:360 (+),score=126.45 TRINITY_DN47896_c0_g1_i1:64-1080(+)